jgi:TonB family protein
MMPKRIFVVLLLVGGSLAPNVGRADEHVPTALKKVAPIYPDSLRRAGVQGVVIIQALVGGDGRVHRTRVVRSVRGLDATALTAMRQWRFNPPGPKAIWIRIPFCFGPGNLNEEDEPVSGRETVWAKVVRPDSSLSAQRRIAFYVARLADSTYIDYTSDGDPYTFVVAPEELGLMGSLALPALIEALVRSDSIYERTQIFYALRLAAQGPGTDDPSAQAELRAVFARFPMAFPEEPDHAALKEAWLRWWARHRNALPGH